MNEKNNDLFIQLLFGWSLATMYTAALLLLICRFIYKWKELVKVTVLLNVVGIFIILPNFVLPSKSVNYNGILPIIIYFVISLVGFSLFATTCVIGKKCLDRKMKNK